MGPVVTAEARARVLRYIDEGVRDGAELVADGRNVTVSGFEGGFFVGPTLFDRVETGMSIYTDEIFGPVLVNVRVDRVKAANMRARPAVALSVVDPRNPYRYLAITGRVVSWSEDGWRAPMDALSRRYLKVALYPWSFPGERRAIFRIEVTHTYSETGEAEEAEA